MNSARREAAPISSAEQAAQAIVELINSRPRSPRPDEIAEIIRKLAIVQPSSHADDLDREYGPATKIAP
jgi:hypothetical protein